ncbi:hypothetical protein F2Q69_00040908 [Brassica cretica]|uniref:Uncharacterized protein n=1 Tax=Brassica cretica TaxID=69181 RepID=A0A8S9NSV7_BRACR|nr:hypothetical protein F2Q69_00040908 [Brassica cretica]
MSHLSLSKDVKTSPEVQKDTISTSLLRSKVVHDLSPRDKEILNPKEEEPSSQGGTNESYMLTEVPRKEPDHKHSHESPHKCQPKIELSVVQMPRLKVSFSDLKMPKTLDNPGIMHLSLPKSFDPGIRQEEFHNNQGQKLQRMQQTKTSYLKKKIILQLVEAIKVAKKKASKTFHQIILLLGGSTPKRIRNVATTI